MVKFTIDELNQGEYSTWHISCWESFDTQKEAKEFLKNLGVKPKEYYVRRDK